jgi:sugar transferase (PEP-CTERM/EpsH1 system associated)
MRRSIRILHVLHGFGHGGLENGIVNIINHSPDHLIHELCFLSHSGEFLQRLERPVIHHVLHKRPGNDVRTIFRLRELFRQRHIDVIHTRNWAAFDGVLAACLMVKPVVIHGEHGRDIADPAGKNRRRNLIRRALSFRARKFVAVSRDLHQWLKSTVRIPEDKLVFIPNGVDTNHFRPGRDLALRKEWDLADDEFVVGTVGRLDPIKNHEGLLAAVRSLNERGYKVRLVIVGDGPERAKIESLLSSSLPPKPLLLGARTDIARIYKAFDLFVLNSFGEGMSNTLLEAMASGLPPVCTDVGGNSELVGEGQRGILLRPRDNFGLAETIREYMSSRERFAGYGQNARSFVVEHFSLDQMIRRYVSLYESVA